MACFLSPSSAQTDAGGRRLFIISYTVDNFLTALLEYLDLKGARLCSLFSKSEKTSIL